MVCLICFNFSESFLLNEHQRWWCEASIQIATRYPLLHHQSITSGRDFKTREILSIKMLKSILCCIIKWYFFADSLLEKAFVKSFCFRTHSVSIPIQFFKLLNGLFRYVLWLNKKPFSCHNLMEINDGKKFRSFFHKKTTREGRSLFRGSGTEVYAVGSFSAEQTSGGLETALWSCWKSCCQALWKKRKIDKTSASNDLQQWHKGVINVVKCKHEGKKLQTLPKGVQTQIDCI